MSSNKKNFSNLLTEVIEGNYCVGCGACVSVCPINVIKFENNNPSLFGKCIDCELCYENCPITEFEEDQFEKKIFNRIKKDEEKNYGITLGQYAVRTVSEKILNHCQDGGAATSLLIQALKEGFNGALVVDKDKEFFWKPIPLIVSNPDEIINTAGTKYSSAPTLKKLKESKSNNLVFFIKSHL